MVFTRGHRDNDDKDSKFVLPPRECRRPRTNLQEPEDELFWDSEDNNIHNKKRTRSSGVTFKEDKERRASFSESFTEPMLRSKRNSVDVKIKTNDSGDDSEKAPKPLRTRSLVAYLSRSLCEDRVSSWTTRRTACHSCTNVRSNSKPRSANVSIKKLGSSHQDSAVQHLNNHQSDDMVGIEGDTDTDDDIYSGKRTTRLRQGLRRNTGGRESRRPHRSPIQKEFVLNVDDELSEKSDHEYSLRRSCRQRKFTSSSQSWLVGDKKLRGYPSMSTHSSEPENEELRPARKARRYIRSSRSKSVSSSLPQRRSLRCRKKPAQLRSHSRDYLIRERSSARTVLRRNRRPPVRYRDSQSEDEEEGDDEEEDEEEVNEEKSLVADNVGGRRHENKDADRKEEKPRRGRRASNKKPVKKSDSEVETENDSEFKQALIRSKRSRIGRPMKSRHSSRLSYQNRATVKDMSSDSENEENRKGGEGPDKHDIDLGNKTETSITPEGSTRKTTTPRETAIQNCERAKRLRKPVSRLMYEHHKRDVKVSSSDESKDDDDDDDADEEEGDEEEQEQVVEENNQKREKRYSLRKKRKPISDPFEDAESHRHRKDREKLSSYLNSPARKPVFSRRYNRSRAMNANTLSSSSSSTDEAEFEKQKSKSMSKSRNRCLPMNMTADDLLIGSIRERPRIGSSLADIDPMSVDTSVRFESIGGLDHHVKSLKEMIMFPLVYPEVFQNFNVTPPRGVLFYGQPGTGKTLVARALANECSQGDKKISFFMRKGADCLSKWVGESERQLRLLFDQAYQMRPSIIFFDEIDGLAPVRSTRQDQIHSSIVSTLLALMDGLDSRGEVVVIGATNRVDAIDPALRRPGRFDREFYFPLPNAPARKEILDIHTKQWTPQPSRRLILYLTEQTVGYCGADLKALCSESALNALRMRYPQIYLSKHKLLLDVSKIQVKFCHFRLALSKLIPAGQRAVSCPGRKLHRAIAPLMQPVLIDVLKILRESFAQGFNKTANGVVTHRPRMLLIGTKGQGHTTHLSPAVLHSLENVPAHKLDLPTLFSVSARAPEEACAQVFHEAKRNLPSIIYIPLIDQWCCTVSDTVKATFMSLLNDLEPSVPILLLATSNTPFDEMDDEVKELFCIYRKEVFVMSNPKEEHRMAFFRPIFFTEMTRKPKVLRNKSTILEELPPAPPPEPRKLSESELKKIEYLEEASLRELRIFLRQICAKLAKNKMFYIFTKPVDLDEVPDYKEVITTPMDLETMMTKIDHHQYVCAEDFLNDIDLICCNALEYNPDRNPEDKIIRHRACTLRDTAYAYIKAEMDTDFEMKCRDVREARQKRQQTYSSAPEFIRVGMPITKLATEAVNGEDIQNVVTTQTQDFHDLKSKGSQDPNRKRKRKSSSWARGFVSTKKKKMEKDTGDDDKKDKENEGVNEHKDCGDSSVDSSGRIDEDESSNDVTDTSQNKVIVESTINLCNGNLSTEDSHDSMRVTSAGDLLYNKSLKEAIQRESRRLKPLEKDCALMTDGEEAVVSSSEPGCSGDNRLELIIDWAHVEAVYEASISTTDGADVEELHYLYTVLMTLCHRHNSSIDRSSLLNEAEVEIRKFAQFRSKPSLHCIPE